MFSPASSEFEVVALAAAVASILAALALWDRMRGRAWLKAAQRVGIIALCQLLAVAGAFAVVNRQNSFYLTWSELAGAADLGAVTIDGGPPASPDPVATTPSSPSASAEAGAVRPSASLFTPGAAGTVEAMVTGARSGVTGQILVWTPPGYSASGPKLPVLLALHGYPGNPIDAINGLGMPAALPQLIASGALPPMIVVAASTNIGGKDWGCADAPGSPRVDTWLTQDVREIVQANFRVREQSRWSVLGLSAGATCAVRLTLLHPDAFGAAVSIAGSNAPDSPALTVDRATRNANNLLTLVAAGTPRAVSLLLAVSRQDPGTLHDAQALQKAIGAHVTADIAVIEHGGHNWNVWAAMTPPALTWIGQHLDH
ncbi:MAG: alpha/beta hydrolase [Cellulomonas sp.]